MTDKDPHRDLLRKHYWLSPADRVSHSLEDLLDRMRAPEMRQILRLMPVTWVLEPVDGKPPWVLARDGEVAGEFPNLEEAQEALKKWRSSEEAQEAFKRWRSRRRLT